jgi:DNA-binding SARP family transcriptional activator
MITIDLLGTPGVRIADRTAPSPRGHKAWALLAYLLLTPRAPSRERVASLLFGEAADPLGALRWNLAQLRRTLGDQVEIGGEPLTVTLPHDSVVDVAVLVSPDVMSAVDVPGLGHDLLEGIDIATSPAFETWLLAERRRLAGVSASVMREAATARLASGDADAAIALASKLVAIEDFDEEAHALLIRSYVAAGDVGRAREQSAKSAAYLRDELGLEPSATLVHALDEPLGRKDKDPRRAEARSERTVEALLEAGRAAVNAGATDAGIETLRRAVDEATAISLPVLRARALLALGGALIHFPRGRDGEGATILHAAVAEASVVDAASVVSEGCRELGYVEYLRARYDRANVWLERAAAEAADEVERATAMGVLGAAFTDEGRTVEAVAALADAASVGRDADTPHVEGWARALLGRVHLLRGETDEAAHQLDTALRICRATGWMSFIPLPQALRAEVHLLRDEIDEATAMAEAAFAMGCQIGDPCWEGLGARAIGMIHFSSGREGAGLTWLEDATDRCVRTADAYLWIQAYCLDALCSMGLQHDRPEVADWVSRLEALAARTGMREMLVRSHLHRAALGDTAAAEAARVFARDIDNPSLLGSMGLALTHGTRRSPAASDASGVSISSEAADARPD